MHDLARWLMSSRGIQMITLVLFVPPLAVAMTVAVALTSGLNVSLLMSVAAVALRTIVDWLTYGPEAASAMVPGRALIVTGALTASVVLARTRSLNLTIQLAVIAMLLGITGFWLVVGDLQAYWMTVAEETILAIREAAIEWRQALGEEAVEVLPLLEEQVGLMASLVTGIAALWYWIVVVLGVVLGHFIWAAHTGKAPHERYGSFLAIRASKTIATITVIAAVASSFVPAPVLINIAVALLVSFVVAGLSLAHWFVRSRGLPGWVLAVMYALLLVSPLQGLILIAICIAGYVDAWFNLAPERMPAR